VTRAHAHVHPSVFAALLLPFGAVNGYVGVAIAYLLAHEGVSAQSVGLMIALYAMPQTWKFLWAPVVDITLTAKRWYLIGAVLSAIGAVAIGACSSRPVDLPVLTTAAVLASLATSFLGMAVEALIAHAAKPQERGRAGGWLQAGNFAGTGLGGGAALWLATHIAHPWLTGAALGACFLLICPALALVHEPPRAVRTRHLARKALDALRDLWAVARSPRGYLALLVLFLPIGSGGASALFSVIPDDWHASATTVELANGALSGVLSLFGCLAGGYVSDWVNRKLAYIGYGLLLGICALAMALAAHTQANYTLFVLLYMFLSGVCYAGFTAVTLEAIGRGAAATKYNVYACLANMPTAYLSALEGWARTHYGVNTFLYIDFAAPIIGALIYGALIAASPGGSGEQALELEVS
jgi:MFS transporter, PAT family, beta-lactamase induction signal transducer AmpG